MHFQVLSTALDKALVDLEDEEKSHFKFAVLYGKRKLDDYWDILMCEMPYYYAVVVLHLFKKLAWFKDKWRRYPNGLRRDRNKELSCDLQQGDGSRRSRAACTSRTKDGVEEVDSDKAEGEG